MIICTETYHTAQYSNDNVSTILCCRYHVSCSESDTYLSVVVESLDLEPAAHCQPDTNSCLDYIQLQYPTGM